jgi:predicted PurR-regulated permease PerM/uncharacterized tellurite resistance protein B-like protein
MKNESFFQRARGQLLNPIAKAVAAAEEVLDHNAEGHEREALLASLINLFVLVLKADGSVSDAELQVVSRALREEHGETVVKQLQERAAADTLPDVKATCAELRGIPVDDREKLLQSLFIAAYADNHYDTEERDCLRRIATELEISDDTFNQLQEAALEQHNARMRVVRSGAGLLAAVVVLALFIVTATFLKAVLFGLMLAYFFLPLQQKLARSFLENGWAAQVYRGVMLCFKPIGWVIGGVQGIFRRGKKKEPKPEPDEAAREKAALDQSCNATVLSVMGAIVLAVAGLMVFTLTYQPPELPKTDVLQKKAADYAAKAKDWKVIGPAAQELETLMRDPEALNKMREWLMGGSAEEEEGKVAEGNKLKTLTALASAVGFLGNFLLNALLAIFFFSFFLKKMAQFHHSHSEQKQEGDYLVESLFQTSWLPTTSEETLRSAAEIVNEVFYKLKTWVRGYLWIIIIETFIYITVFLLLGVPYAIVLGGIAGLTVLLPFLGPLVSAVLTIGTCLVTGHADLTLLITIGGVYVVMNLIVEQLFLYPAFVGEALGLNVLETLIVVLLGGLFAGLAGVIFAVPAASVLKFIIPRLYQSLFQKEEITLPEDTPGG